MADTPTKVIVDCKTGKTAIVPLSAEEIAERDALAAQAQAEEEAREAEEAAKVAAKESAVAKLTALGLTEEEALALVG